MYIFDIETNGLLRELTKIHTIHIYDTDSDKYYKFDKEETVEGVKMLDGSEIMGHNIIAFDVPAIKKLYPDFKPTKVWDTMVMTRLVFADIKDSDMKYVATGKLDKKLIGSHKLKAWGQRLGVLKGDFGETTDWAEWSQEMSDYCKQDVEVTVAIYNHLKKYEAYLVPQAVELEHKVQTIIARQMEFGFEFDLDKAEELYAVLMQRKHELTKQFRDVFKPWLKPDKEFTPKKNNRTKGYIAGASFCKLKLEEFKPSSTSHIAYQLKKLYGWEPDTFTDSKQEKVDGDVLEKLDYPEAKLIAEYLLVDKRLQQLATGNQAWLSQVDPDGRMRGYVNTNGAVTGRMTHSNPNMAQVPAVDKPYGPECRGLFRVPKGYKLVGCDASGLELRTLSHYLARYDGGAYAREVLQGDIHTANQKSAGLPTRNSAKTFIYGWLYGGGDLMIGLSINNPLEQVLKYKQTHKDKFLAFRKRFAKTSYTINGKVYTKVSKGKWCELTDALICYAIDGYLIKERFLSNLPALTNLRDAVAEKAKTQKYIKGLDGRILKIRSAHSALNVLLQSAGALVMKQYLVMLDDNLQKQFKVGVDYEFVGNIHDEVQIQVKEEYAERVAEVCVSTFKEVTDYFSFRILLEGEAKIGSNWKETH